MEQQQDEREFRKGLWYTVTAFSAWGLLPLYWKALKAVPSPQILAHRIIWSLVLVIILLKTQKRLSFASFRNKPTLLFSLLSACFIGANWSIYIWAVNAGHVVATSMGYFINPLVSVLLGVLILRERLTKWQGAAVLVALGGVAYLAVSYGQLPWIALSLAFTFGFYGLLRKTSRVDSVTGLAFETAVLAVPALIFLVTRDIQGSGAIGHVSVLLHILLIGTGVVTALPLIWFAHGARRIPLSMVGFLQYIAPTTQLCLGVFVFGEPFTRNHLISFSLIWGALVLYSLTHTRWFRKQTARA
jgi:chloramphenicol-sensitive protein RarD